MIQSESFNRLIAAFRSLPGVGTKTAQRYAYSIIEGSVENAEAFASAVIDAKNNVKFCSVCGNFTENDLCELCISRSPRVICVVAQPKDIDPIEKTGAFNGAYHVLHGVIDIQKGIDADKLRIRELISRISEGKTEEVIIATNPDLGGELTGAYLASVLKPLGVKVSRLAYGISIGSEIEYADSNTLQHALSDRKPL